MVSGYNSVHKINYISVCQQEITGKWTFKIPFSIASKPIKCLVISLVKDAEDLYTGNYKT